MDVKSRVRDVVILLWIAGCVRPALLFHVGNAAQARSVHDGVYTEVQAERGAKIFAQFCLGCHETKRFMGEQMKPWVGQTAYEFFRKIRLTMPEDRPGGLPRQQYADIVAYIFRLNGFKAGNDELTPADEMLQTIRIDHPAP